jgi:hypothetical protein
VEVMEEKDHRTYKKGYVHKSRIINEWIKIAFKTFSQK